MIISRTLTSIYVEWKPPVFDGGCPIKGYALWVDDGTETNNFVEANVNNDVNLRSNPAIFSYTITRLPTSAAGLKIFTKVTAFNEIGEVTSDVCSTIIAVVPDAPPALKTITSKTNERNITLDLSDWTDSFNGGSDIISFEIQM